MKKAMTFSLLLISLTASAQVIDTSKQKAIHIPEIITQKASSRLSASIGYTTCRIESPFAVVNDNNLFPAVSDRIHDFSFLGIYRLNSRWSLSGNLVESNGNLASYAPGKFGNSYNTPGTKRVDIGATLDGEAHKTYQYSWTVGIYNVNGYRDAGPPAGIIDTRIIARPVPSVSWNIKLR